MPRPRPLRSLFALILLAVLAAEVRGDVVWLKDGGKLEGDIIAEDRDSVKVRINAQATVEVSRRDVDRIERKPSKRDELLKRRAALDPKDAQGRYELAGWCRKRAMSGEARSLYEETIALEPDHVGARAALGYVRFKGRWILEDDFYRAKGFVRRKGRWIPREEAARAELAERLKKRIGDHLRDLRKGGSRAVMAEKALLEIGHPELTGPLLLARLEREKSDYPRRVLIRALQAADYGPSAPIFLELALSEDRPAIARLAVEALWGLSDEAATAAKKTLVGGLFERSARRRMKAAALLEGADDLEVAPYLIEGLFLVGLRSARGELTTLRRLGLETAGSLGRYFAPGGPDEVLERPERVDYLFNPAARQALRGLSGKDFDYDKAAWFAWWLAQKAPSTKPAGG